MIGLSLGNAPWLASLSGKRICPPRGPSSIVAAIPKPQPWRYKHAKEGDAPAFDELTMEQMVGLPVPMKHIPVGMLVQGIEVNIGQGGKLGRARGSYATIVRKQSDRPRVTVRLPSGVEKVLDSRCSATVGPLVNPNYTKPKLYKAGQNRWKGIRPTVRGVAKNPVDLPRGGRINQSRPWGRGCKRVRKSPPWELKE